ncbi:MAG: hypothetical protein BHV78_04030 [Bacteroides sp. CAG:1060_57_27]|nr:MAG: hypothetical protein BHV78_04030 [Bacteroides sp. CAG:1060_57_27]
MKLKFFLTSDRFLSNRGITMKKASMFDDAWYPSGIVNCFQILTFDVQETVYSVVRTLKAALPCVAFF